MAIFNITSVMMQYLMLFTRDNNKCKYKTVSARAPRLPIDINIVIANPPKIIDDYLNLFYPRYMCSNFF